MKDEVVQKMITLTKDNLTLAKAIEIAGMSARARVRCCTVTLEFPTRDPQMVTCKK